jgi:hypothetical protein
VELVSFLLTASPSYGIRSLVTGNRPGDSEFAALASEGVGKLISGMLDAQKDSMDSLARIEHKLDDLRRDRFRASLKTAYRLLAEAQPAHREPEDRSRLIDAAFEELITAAAEAENARAPAEAVVQTEVLIATCWLAKGSVRDFERVLATAAELAFSGIVELNQPLVSPGYDAIYRSSGRGGGTKASGPQYELTTVMKGGLAAE